MHITRNISRNTALLFRTVLVLWVMVPWVAHAQFPPVSENPNLLLTNVVGGFPNPGTILAIARQPDGKTVVGGIFTHVGGLERHNLVRFNRDGSLDTEWAPNPDGSVLGLDVHGGYIYVGGDFDVIGGFLRYGIARIPLTGTDAPDPLWNPDAQDAGFVRAIVATDDAVYVGGDFAFIGGYTVNDLAKLNLSTGAADPSWFPAPFDFNQNEASVYTLALDGSDLFVGGIFTQIGGGLRTNLAKISADTGAVAPLWIANTDGGDILSLSIVGTQIYASGFFTQIGGINRSHVARINTTSAVVDTGFNANASGRVWSVRGTENEVYIGGEFLIAGGFFRDRIARLDLNGNADPTWNPGSDGFVTEMLVSDKDVLAAGTFSLMSGQQRYGLAQLTVPEAPVLVQTGSNTLQVTRNPDDGPEVTHFRIFEINGGTLRRADGSPILPGGFVSIADGEAGLTLNPGAMVSISSAVRPENFADGIAFTSLTMGASAPPTFRIAVATLDVSESSGSILIEIQKISGGAASVNYATRNETALLGSDYGGASGTGQLSFGASETSKFISVPITNDGDVEGDESFAIDISGPSNGGLLASPATIVITIIDNDLTGNTASDLAITDPSPALPGTANASLQVNLSGDSGQGLWKLKGDVTYRASGTTVSGLTTGNYQVEFRPLDKLTAPPPVTVPIDGSISTTVVANASYTTGDPFDPGTGSLVIQVEPLNIANQSQASDRGQWRRLGETLWKDSGDSVSLTTGRYEVEFKSLAGRITPPSIIMAVQAGQTNVANGLYLIETSATPAPEPAVLPFNGASAVTAEPYRYNGQIHTEMGFGSGVVTKPHTVLTAAHVVFNDAELAYVKEVNWFHQRHRGDYEPAATQPRGWYRFDSYAAQRESDVANPSVGAGVGSPESQNLDVAALYFSSPAARGGAGGYLASDSIGTNPWLGSSQNKFVVGYPVDGINLADRGRMHTTAPANDSYTHIQNFVYRTTSFRTTPGNSGGAIYVRANNGSGGLDFYPAAIYLGGTDQTLVRAIDSAVVNLMNLAEVAGSTDNNGTGGGAFFTAPGFTEDALAIGQLTTLMRSPRDGGWRVADGGGTTLTRFFDSEDLFLAAPGDFDITFRDVPGFTTPSARTATVFANQLTQVDAAYTQDMAGWTTLNLTNLGVTTNDGPLDDHDQDGLVHLIERAFNLSAIGPDHRTITPDSGTTGLPHGSFVGSGSNGRLTLEFVRWDPAVATDLSYIPEFSDSPDGPYTTSPLSPTITDLSGGWQRVVIQDGFTQGQRSSRFGRVRVVQSP